MLERLEPRLAPLSVLATWGKGWQTANPILKSDPILAEELTRGKEWFATALQIVREFHQRGVHLAAGTDVGMPWITPGVSFHRELELLVEAGIPPLQVLSIATKNGAEGLRASIRFGVIAPGMLADLVVLREDPIQDIRNTRSIEAVYKEGQRFEPGSLLLDLR